MILISLLLVTQATSAQAPCPTRLEMQSKAVERLERIKGLYAKRRVIADRRMAIANGNPIARGLSSLVDRNADPKHLKELDDLLVEQIDLEVAEHEMEQAAFRGRC